MKEGSVFNCLTLPVENHQAGVVPFLNGILCYQFRWKIIIKFFYMHAISVKAPGNQYTKSLATRDPGKLDYKAFLYSKDFLVLSRVLAFLPPGQQRACRWSRCCFFKHFPCLFLQKTALDIFFHFLKGGKGNTKCHYMFTQLFSHTFSGKKIG